MDRTPEYVLADKVGNLVSSKNTEIEQLRAALTEQQQHVAALEAQLEAAQAENAKMLELLKEARDVMYCQEMPSDALLKVYYRIRANIP